MTDTADKPGVIVLPPLLALGTLVLGFVLSWAAPTFVLRVVLPFELRVMMGLVLAAGGVALAVAGARTFREVGTNVAPTQPALKLATTGIYAHLRNPMYVGLGLLVAGIGVGFASDWTLVLLVPAALVIHYGVVLREEVYLARKFGDTYRRYKDVVPRYGWPV
jgi:protein-S-isoprenylcysteine O-methyltransferase Ste14